MLDSSAVSPDGKTIATASCDPVNTSVTRCEKENILLWDMDTRIKNERTLSVEGDIYNEQAVYLRYSPDGSLLALSYNNPTAYNQSKDNHPTIVLWDMQTFKEVGRVETGIGLTQMAFSPDGKTLAYVSDLSLVVLNVASLEKTVVASPGATGNLLSLAYSHNGKMLALGGANGIISLLNTQTYERVGPTLVYISKALSLSFSPDDQVLVSGHYNAGINYWDVATGLKLLKNPLFKHVETPDGFPIFALTFSPDGKILASASNEVILWDMSKDSWLARACDIAGRNFSQHEWELNFPGEAYRVICPAWPEGK
jgi:WD40 repeat protein